MKSKKIAMGVILLLTCIAASPTSQRVVVKISPSATQPAPIAELRSRVKSADDDLRAAEMSLAAAMDSRRTATMSTEQYVALKADADQKEAVLKQARASGTPQEKLAASGAFVAAKCKADELLASAIKSDVEISDAQESLAIARIKAADAKTALSSAENDEKWKAASRASQKRVTKGMSLNEVKVMWGDPEESTITDDGRGRAIWRDYEWVDANPGIAFNQPLRAVDPLSVVPGQGHAQVRRVKRTLMIWLVDGAVARSEDTGFSDASGKIPQPDFSK
jgi:hypothetical protein